MFVNDDIYYFFIGYDRKLKAERRQLPDNMFCNTCKSYTLFLETAGLQKACRLYYHPLTNLSLASVGFLLIIETLIISLATKRLVV